MKSKIFVMFLSITSLSQASYVVSTLKFDTFIPNITTLKEVGKKELKELGGKVATTALVESIQSLRTAALETMRDTSKSIINSCTVENYDIYGTRFLQSASSVAMIYYLLYGINRLGSNGEIEAITWKNISSQWGGPLPKEFEEILKAEKHHATLKKEGLSCHNGYLFHGEPGTGKTFFARVLSDKLGTPLIETNSGQFLSLFQGSGNKKLETILKKARSLRPKFYQSQSKPFSCIVFIDEIDGLQRNRPGVGSNGEEDRFMNDFLAIITDPQNSDILFIGATNSIKKIDEALKRDGRLVPIKFELPSDEIRTAILTTIFKKYKITEPFEAKDLLEKTKGFSSATLEEMVKRATINALINQLEEAPTSFFGEFEKLLAERKQQEIQKDAPEAMSDATRMMYT